MMGIRRLAVAGMLVAGSLAGLTAHADEVEGCIAVGGQTEECAYVASGDASLVAQGDWEIVVSDAEGNELGRFTDDETFLSKEHGISAPSVGLEEGIQAGDHVTLRAFGAGSFIRAGEPGLGDL